MQKGWRSLHADVEHELRTEEAGPVLTAVQRILAVFDREQGWRGRGEQAIRDEMDRACARRRLSGARA